MELSGAMTRGQMVLDRRIVYHSQKRENIVSVDQVDVVLLKKTLLKAFCLPNAQAESQKLDQASKKDQIGNLLGYTS